MQHYIPVSLNLDGLEETIDLALSPQSEEIGKQASELARTIMTPVNQLRILKRNIEETLANVL